jgi:hypothetical protein
MRNHILKFIFILIVFVSCQNENAIHTNALFLAQSRELIIANKRELHGLLSKLAEINLNEKMQTSYEYEKISSMRDELEKFDLEMQNAEWSEMIKLINDQNSKFKNDNVFKIQGFKFEPIKVEELNYLDKEVLKIYAVSKISRFYVDSAGYIFTTRSYGREKL